MKVVRYYHYTSWLALCCLWLYLWRNLWLRKICVLLFNRKFFLVNIRLCPEITGLRNINIKVKRDYFGIFPVLSYSESGTFFNRATFNKWGFNKRFAEILRFLWWLDIQWSNLLRFITWLFRYKHCCTSFYVLSNVPLFIGRRWIICRGLKTWLCRRFFTQNKWWIFWDMLLLFISF